MASLATQFPLHLCHNGGSLDVNLYGDDCDAATDCEEVTCATRSFDNSYCCAYTAIPSCCETNDDCTPYSKSTDCNFQNQCVDENGGGIGECT